MAAVPPAAIPPGVLAMTQMSTVCQVDQVQHGIEGIIVREGFDTPDLFATMLTNDQAVGDMAKRLSNLPNNWRADLGGVPIKCLQALAWWMHDKLRHGQAIDPNDWTPAVMDVALATMLVQGEVDTDDPQEKDLAKFDPLEFEVHEDAFLNHLAKCKGTLASNLKNICRKRNPPAVFADAEEERMYQFQHTGPRFDQDNRNTF